MPHRAEATGSLTAGHQLPTPGPGSAPSDGGEDGDVKLPLSVQPIGGGIGMLVDADGVPVVGDDGMPILRNMDTPGTGSAPSAPAFGSTQAGFAAQTQADIDAAAVQAGIDRDAAAARVEADKEAALLAQEGANRRERLGTLTRLIEGFLGQQSQARDTLANLQPDPFRFAAVAGGIAPFGTTPQQGFQEQLQQFAGAAVPQFDPSGSAASLDPVIAQLTGAQAPQQPQMFGMAGGGTVPVPPPGAAPQVRRVGERGPETMVVDQRGVTILPFDIGAGTPGFQEGGAIGFPFEPIKFDTSTLLPALGTSGIFGSLGIDQIPTTRRGSEGEIFGTGFPGTPTFNKLGITPSLVRDTMTSNVFLIQNGQHRLINPEEFVSAGFNRSDIVNLAHEDVLRLARQRGEDLPMDFRQQIPTTQPSPFTKFSAPIIEPTTGTVLPAPFMVASQLNQLRVTNPTMFNLMLSAYEAAGQPATSVLSTIQSALPFGQARGNIGLN